MIKIGNYKVVHKNARGLLHQNFATMSHHRVNTLKYSLIGNKQVTYLKHQYRRQFQQLFGPYWSLAPLTSYWLTMSQKLLKPVSDDQFYR